MRILHAFDHSIPLQSGYSFRSRSILIEQRKRGWETVHVTGAKQGEVSAASEVVGEFEFHRTPPPSALANRVPVVDQLAISDGLERRIREVAEETKPDIIHAHSPVLNGLAALRAARKLRLPVVYEIRAFWEDAAVDHGTTREKSVRYRATHGLETWVSRRVDALTTICGGLRTELLGRGIEPERVTIIPNAVDASRFDPNVPRDRELTERYGLGDRPVLGFIGSFYAYEGITELVQVLPRVLKSVPELRVLLVGGGPCHDAVQALIRQHDLAHAVIAPGRVPHEEVDRYYTLVDAFCYPRQPMRLTDLVTPLKPLEAMAQGKLVIASDVGGHRELITNGKTGILFPCGDRDALTEAIIRAFSLPAGGESMRQAGRHFVEFERTWTASVARYENVYARATERNASGRA